MFVIRCRCGGSKICCSSAASISAARRYVCAGTGLARCSPRGSENGASSINRIRGDDGICTRCLSASTVKHITCGAPSITKAIARSLCDKAPRLQSSREVSQTNDEALRSSATACDRPASLNRAAALAQWRPIPLETCHSWRLRINPLWSDNAARSGRPTQAALGAVVEHVDEAAGWRKVHLHVAPMICTLLPTDALGAG